MTEKLLSAWGAATWDVGREFGTIGVREGATVEVTTYRSDSYEVGSRKPKVDFGRTLRATSPAATSPSTPWRSAPRARAGRPLRRPRRPRRRRPEHPRHGGPVLRRRPPAHHARPPASPRSWDSTSARTSCPPWRRWPSASESSPPSGSAPSSSACSSPLRRAGESNCSSIRAWPTSSFPRSRQLRDTVDEHKRHKDVYEHTLTVLDQAIDLETGARRSPSPAPTWCCAWPPSSTTSASPPPGASCPTAPSPSTATTTSAPA